MPKKIILAVLGCVFFIALAAWFAPRNGPLEGVAISVLGSTNVSGKPHLLVRLPKMFNGKVAVTFGHKGWYLLSLHLQCVLKDGTMTNVFVRDRADPPHLEQVVLLPVPEGSNQIRIVEAEGRIGSFQDIELPFDLELPPTRGTYPYIVPREVFTVNAN